MRRTAAIVIAVFMASGLGLLTATPVAGQDDPGPAPTFAVAGQFSEGSLAFLDRDGRPLGFTGSPDETFGAIKACAGTSLLVQDAGPSGLTIIDAAAAGSTNTPVRIDLSSLLSSERTMADLQCLADGNPEIRFITETFTNESFSFDAWSVTVDMATGAVSPVVSLGPLAVPLGGRVAVAGRHVLVIATTETGERLELLEPDVDGGLTPMIVATVDVGSGLSARFTEPAIGPDGRIAIGERTSGSDGSMSARVLVIDPEKEGMTDRFDVDGVSEVVWLAQDRLGVVAFGLADDQGIDVYSIDATLRSAGVVGSVEPWSGWASAMVDDTIWGLRGNTVVQAPVGGGSLIAHDFGETAFGPLIVVDPSASAGASIPLADNPSSEVADSEGGSNTSPARLALLGLIVVAVVGGGVAAVRQMRRGRTIRQP